MKIAILGGSFNPVHTGHLFLADAVISAFAYDRVILVPAHRSPFKPDAGGAPPKERLSMLAASIAGDPRLSIDDCELKREGVSYTIDTVMDIKKRYCPDGKPGLILGDDLASAFHEWNRAEDIAEEADIIMARRLFGSSSEAGLAGTNFPYPHKELNNELINISSRLVREKIARGENWRYLVPSGARYIIEEQGLYAETAEVGGKITLPEGRHGYFGAEKAEVGSDQKNRFPIQTIVLVENAAREALNVSRFLHSRNTALMVFDLCIQYGLNPASGYLAGIAHDICKSMKDEELIQLARSGDREMTALEKKKPGLLHGRAAAVLLKDRYGINDKEILNAVSSHVTCGKEMNDLAKALYIADKLEISREYVSPRLREMCGNAELDELFRATLEETVSYLKSRQKDVSYNALRLLSSAKKRKKNDKKNKG